MVKKIVIIPDVHARDFWRTPVMESLEKDDSKIIFLGDYLDPYPDEWEEGFDYSTKAISTFKEILELKTKYPERITLLLGNHDCGYAVDTNICECRSDVIRYREISQMFHDSITSFKLADEATINGIHFIFSHAGITKEYAEHVYGENNVSEDNVVTLFNEDWDKQTWGVLFSLGIYDRYRGWFGRSFASLVWADVREWLEGTQGYGYQVFGHSRLRIHSLLGERYACLDSKNVFYIDEQGEIRDYSTDEIQKVLEKTK